MRCRRRRRSEHFRHWLLLLRNRRECRVGVIRHQDGVGAPPLMVARGGVRRQGSRRGGWALLRGSLKANAKSIWSTMLMEIW
jgi:hypothetical protein